jgi:hypothetical protein
MIATYDMGTLFGKPLTFTEKLADSTSARNRRRLEAKARRKFDEAVRMDRSFKDVPVEVFTCEAGEQLLAWGVAAEELRRLES